MSNHNTQRKQRFSMHGSATSIEWVQDSGRYTYVLELAEAESAEVSRLAGYGYDCGIADACHDITWPREGIVAYHFHENEAHEVAEAYNIIDSALATCGMESLLDKVRQFAECVV